MEVRVVREEGHQLLPGHEEEFQLQGRELRGDRLGR